MRDLWRRSGLSRASLERLAAADSFRSLGLDRRQALWEVRGLPPDIPLPLFEHAKASEAGAEGQVQLPLMRLSEHVVNDYRTLRLSLKAHPVSFLRDRIAGSGALACGDLRTIHDGARVSVAGRRALLEVRRGTETISMAANLGPRPQAADDGDLQPFEARFRRTLTLRPAAATPIV